MVRVAPKARLTQCHPELVEGSPGGSFVAVAVSSEALLCLHARMQRRIVLYGITNDVERRVGEHNTAWDPNSYTHERRPVALVYSEHFTNVDEAIRWEKQIKKWSRLKKIALIKAIGKRCDCLGTGVLRQAQDDTRGVRFRRRLGRGSRRLGRGELRGGVRVRMR